MIRMLEARIRVVTLRIDELEQEKAARTLIEETINLRNELVEALENLQSNE